MFYACGMLIKTKKRKKRQNPPFSFRDFSWFEKRIWINGWTSKRYCHKLIVTPSLPVPLIGTLRNRTAGRLRTAEWRKNVARDCAFQVLRDIFIRHSAVLNLPAVLLRKVPNFLKVERGIARRGKSGNKASRRRAIFPFALWNSSIPLRGRRCFSRFDRLGEVMKIFQSAGNS